MQIVLGIIAVLLLIIDRGKDRPSGSRSPYKAVAASLVFPGLGQLYNGQPRKAFLVWAGGVLLVLLATLARFPLYFWGMAFLWLGAVALFVVGTADALRIAKSSDSYTLKAYNRWYVYIGLIVGFTLISESIGDEVVDVKAFRMPTESMLPALHVGDFFIAENLTDETYTDRRGDILMFKYPGDNRTDYVKRVVGFPGERIEIRNGHLLVDENIVKANWAQYPDRFNGSKTDFGPFTVPDGTLFMLGDNLINSADSRAWGPLPRQNLVGVARYVYFSWDPDEHSPQWTRIAESLLVVD